VAHHDPGYGIYMAMSDVGSRTRLHLSDRPGRAERFERAYREHRPVMLATAHAVLHDAAAAEDVVQDVFAQLWTRPTAYDASRGGLRSYLTLLARSRALDRWRSRSARAAATERSARDRRPAAPETPDEVAMRRESAALARSAVDSLPDAQRSALLLTFGAGLSTQQMAEAARIPLGTAKSRVRLDLEKARLELEAHDLERAA